MSLSPKSAPTQKADLVTANAKTVFSYINVDKKSADNILNFFIV